LPSWSLEVGEARARAAEAALRDPRRRAGMLMRPAAADAPPERLWLDVFSRLRTCTGDEKPCSWSGPPDEAPAGCRPWFEWPHARGGTTVLFGHWAALGFHRVAGAIGLDSACSWGGRLTAWRLEDGAVVQQPLIDAVA
jgi:bis(5'-nucleosyl)-tetraphosphatase (symmetrical)